MSYMRAVLKWAGCSGSVDACHLSPRGTLALLKLNAVVGVKGFLNEAGTLTSIGLTCAICHSTVDDSFSPGIGRRLDGWAARDLNVGRIVAAVGVPVTADLEAPRWIVFSAIPAVLPHMNSGKLRIIGVGSPQRLANLSN